MATTTKRGPSVERLIKQGAEHIVAINEYDTQRTATLVKLAKVMVQLRGKFEYKDRVDWAGRSQAYRDAAQRMYEEAGVGPDSTSNIQAAVRYHIGNELREQVSKRELTAVGLDVKSPRAKRAAKMSPATTAPPSENVHGAGGGESGEVIDLRQPAVATIQQAIEFVRQARDKMPSGVRELRRLRVAVADLSSEVVLLMHELDESKVGVAV